MVLNQQHRKEKPARRGTVSTHTLMDLMPMKTSRQMVPQRQRVIIVEIQTTAVISGVLQQTLAIPMTYAISLDVAVRMKASLISGFVMHYKIMDSYFGRHENLSTPKELYSQRPLLRVDKSCLHVKVDEKRRVQLSQNSWFFFCSPEPLAPGELLLPLDVHRPLSVVCSPSSVVNNCFKRHLLPNYWLDFDQTW